MKGRNGESEREREKKGMCVPGGDQKKRERERKRNGERGGGRECASVCLFVRTPNARKIGSRVGGLVNGKGLFGKNMVVLHALLHHVKSFPVRRVIVDTFDQFRGRRL